MTGGKPKRRRGDATLPTIKYPSRTSRLFYGSFIALALAASTTACVKTTTGGQPSSSPTFHATTVPMGTRVQTTAGNEVVVYSFLPSIGKGPGTDMTYVAADIQACGGPHATTVTGVERTFFYVETADARAWPSVVAVKKPELKPALLAPNKCIRGWVTFSVPRTLKAVYVVFKSSALAKWKIP